MARNIGQSEQPGANARTFHGSRFDVVAIHPFGQTGERGGTGARSTTDPDYSGTRQRRWLTHGTAYSIA